jgi:hypothetical protein
VKKAIFYYSFAFYAIYLIILSGFPTTTTAIPATERSRAGFKTVRYIDKILFTQQEAIVPRMLYLKLR